METLKDAIMALSEVDQSVSKVDGGSLEWQIVNATANSPVSVVLRGSPKAAEVVSMAVPPGGLVILLVGF